MVLIETVGQQTKIRDSETSQPNIRESETQGYFKWTIAVTQVVYEHHFLQNS